MNSPQHHIIFIDGYCVLCNRAVRFLIWLDYKKRFSFSTLNSSFAQKNIGKESVQSILVMDKNGEIFEKSNAIRVITNQLILLQWIGLIIWLLPTSFTDHLYMAIAKHRYRIFGKYDSCPLVNNKKVVERLIL